MPVLPLYSELDLHTRCENQIENAIDRRPIRAGDQIASNDARNKYPKAIHRPTTPSRKYNCHGLTFASRRTWVEKPEVIAGILTDDDYVSVDPKHVMPGDVAIFKTRGVIEHSGLVVEVRGDGPWILSKWGALHEVIHRPRYGEYADCDEILYYRIVT